MELFWQQVINGLTLGSVYSLVALGLTLIYGIMQLPNFAHGHIYMVGAYVTLIFMTVFGLNYWVAIIISIMVMAVLGTGIERIVFHPLHKAPQVNMLIAAVGVLLFLESGARVLWGSDYRRMDSPYGTVLNIYQVVVPE